MTRSFWSDLLGKLGRALTSGPDRPRPGRRAGAPAPTRPTARGTRAYPGDFTGTVRPEYSPALDGDADPGEIVWTWVPYEEDASQGKDRPVLVVGRDGPWLLALMLTSKDHSRDAADEARWGRRWVDIGAGPWDRKGRPSEIRLDRVLRIDPVRVRREGAIMDRRTFDAVVAGL
ncbi:type II toxin-antitoxin system PemK/MazF family toxin [Luteimicrobium sp. DT211]|uniref:type II toxin-antitoxin system PemK/MazF family toxin n=1 Tax=Luteimicrobium sp. DT211 TaxID=3393412 RepID=UPI003CE6BED4